MTIQHVINTSQNVTIDLNLAGVGDRLMALIIDLVILTGVSSGTYLFIKLFGVNDLDDFMMILIAVIGFVNFLYFFLCEWLMEGQTFGKRYHKIKVIHMSGAQATVSQLMIRNLVRIVDSVYGIGLVSVFFSNKSQRLGDLASGTLVVSLRKNTELKDTIHSDISSDYQPTFTKVEILKVTESDLEVVKEVIARDFENLNWKLVGSLADTIKKKTSIGDNSMKPLQFLKTIVSDYQFYGQE